MAISANSKILASDVSGKVDTAGTGLTKSGTTLSLATVVTAGNAGPKANATPNFGATFTVPYITYDAYGRITGRTNRTVKIPAAPSSTTTSTKTNATPNVAAWHGYYDGWRWGVGKFSQGTKTDDWYYTKWTAPSGGTWGIFTSSTGKTISGGTTVETQAHAFAIRIA